MRPALLRRNILLVLLLSAGALLATVRCASAAPPSRAAAAGTAGRPIDYSSAHFLVHTDLPQPEAAELLQRLETMLGLISSYWGRPPSGIIECYVVRDLANWPPGVLDPAGRAKIESGAGVTISQTLTSGNRFLAKAVVYAVADHGTPQHESVHAYCVQAFGRTGPIWYAEGMAEMGQYWRKDDRSVQIPPPVLDYLTHTRPRSLNAIVNGEQLSGDSWRDYAWRWALCHLLANNPNYAPRFRPLGLGLLMKQPTSFEQVYGPVADEISFEYLEFIAHLENGYRADLCAWDWKRKSIPLGGGGTATSKIRADHGWQPSGAIVAKDRSYAYETTGKWRTTKGGAELSADGEAGQGRLLGIVLTKFTLSEPLELGASGTFTAPADGTLYLRCQDGWGSLADNEGQITVKVKAAKAKPAE